MNIVSVEVRNIQGLHWVCVEPKAAGTTMVGGKNRAGKSSLLNAIAWTLGGVKLCPENPIRTGEAEASCSIDLSAEPARMLPACTVTRSWNRKPNGDEDSTLTIKTADGYKAPSPQSILDTINGTLGFEPEAFMRATDKEQARILRELVGIDFTEKDAEYERLFKERTTTNSNAKNQLALIEAKVVHADAPLEPVSVSALMEELSKREVVIADNSKTRGRLAGIECNLKDLDEGLRIAEDAVAQAIKRRDELKTQQGDLEIKFIQATQECSLLQDPDVESVREAIRNADELNRKFRENSERKNAVDYHAELVAESEDYTKKLSDIKAFKEKATTEAKWPVEGLGFNEHGVTYLGRQLKQASSMEQIQVSVAIRAALAPSLQFAFLRDGSLLDEEQLANVAAFAESKGLQLFIERVGTGQECDIVISEGRVVGQTEPVPEKVPAKPKKKPGTLLGDE